MSVKITYFVHGTTRDNEKNISSGWVKLGNKLSQKIGGRRERGNRAESMN